jgi:hypothetical protein
LLSVARPRRVPKEPFDPSGTGTASRPLRARSTSPCRAALGSSVHSDLLRMPATYLPAFRSFRRASFGRELLRRAIGVELVASLGPWLLGSPNWKPVITWSLLRRLDPGSLRSG